jgi:hypothetical protein
MAKEIKESVELFDVYDSEGSLKFDIEASGLGIYIMPEGFGDACTIQAGCPVKIEMQGDVPYVIIWGDINSEDPTHQISLAGAKEELREEFGCQHEETYLWNGRKTCQTCKTTLE